MSLSEKDATSNGATRMTLEQTSFARPADHKLLHRGEKLHICGPCGKTFTLKGNLNTHKRLHSKEKSYKCDHCGKGFNYKSNLDSQLSM